MYFMGNNKKVLGAIVGVMVGTCVVNANAQNIASRGIQNENMASAPVKAVKQNMKSEAILFKIHDISSLKNNEGAVVACNFSATFYNRSDKDINGATIRLNWNDKTIASVIDDELRESAAKRKLNDKDGRYTRSSSTTERVTPANVEATLEMPAIKAYKQMTLTSKLQSDRCFLLLNDVDFKVDTCSASENQDSVAMSRGGSGNTDCVRLFQYVSAKSPAYYKEFKKVSYDEEKAAKQTEMQKNTQEINRVYSETIDALNATSGTLSRIK